MRLARITVWMFIGIAGFSIMTLILGRLQNPIVVELAKHLRVFFFLPASLAFAMTAHSMGRLSLAPMFVFILFCFERRGFNEDAFVSVCIAFTVGFLFGKLAHTLVENDEHEEIETHDRDQLPPWLDRGPRNPEAVRRDPRW